MSPLVTDEIRKLIGWESAAVGFEVEKGAIRKVLRALEDNNPIWQSLEAAGAGAEVVVPPAYLMSVLTRLPDVKVEVPLKRMVGGDAEWKFFSPLKLCVGQTVLVSRRLIDILEKAGKAGPMLLTVFEDSFKSESGRLLATHRFTLIRL